MKKSHISLFCLFRSKTALTPTPAVTSACSASWLPTPPPPRHRTLRERLCLRIPLQPRCACLYCPPPPKAVARLLFCSENPGAQEGPGC